MEKGEQSFANVWDIDHSKYNADADHVEEVIVEVEEGKGADTTKVKQEIVPEEGTKTDDETGKPISDAEGGEAQGAENAVEKQGEEEEVVKEDASTKAPEKPKAEEAAAEPIDETGINGLVDDFVKDELLDYVEDKEYSDGEKGLKEVIADTIEKRTTAAIDEYKNSLGDDAKKMIDILEKGGSFDDYSAMEKQENFSEIPLESKSGTQYEQNQAYLIEDWLKVQGFTEEEAKDQVQEFHEAGLLRKQAELSQKKLAAWQETQNNALVAQRETEKAERERLAEEEATQFKEEVIATRELSGFNISEAKANKLYDFITKTDKDGLSEFAKANTKENQLLFAYFAMEGFNKDKLSKEIATKQARTLKRKLSRFKDDNAAPKRGGGEQVRKTDQESPDIPWLL